MLGQEIYARGGNDGESGWMEGRKGVREGEEGMMERVDGWRGGERTGRWREWMREGSGEGGKEKKGEVEEMGQK